MAHANFSMICEVVTFLGHPSCRLWLSYARYQYLLLERHSTVRQWWLESSIIHASVSIVGASLNRSSVVVGVEHYSRATLDSWSESFAVGADGTFTFVVPGRITSSDRNSTMRLRVS